MSRSKERSYRQTSRSQASENRLATSLEEFFEQFAALVSEDAALNFEAVIEGRAVT
jgi:hypothetical protein